MSLKKHVVQPIILGIVVMAAAGLTQWLLAVVGFSSVIVVQVPALSTGWGIVSVIVMFWVVGLIMPYVVKEAERFVGRSL
jgi:hypothetical protein